jgi:hypothetical protein
MRNTILLGMLQKRGNKKMNRNIDHVDAHGKKIEISSKETENKYYKMKGRYSFSL